MSYLQARGLRVPRKSSCRRCPYHDDLYWLSLPAPDFEAACSFDDWLRTPRGREQLGSKPRLSASFVYTVEAGHFQHWKN